MTRTQTFGNLLNKLKVYDKHGTQVSTISKCAKKKDFGMEPKTTKIFLRVFLITVMHLVRLVALAVHPGKHVVSVVVVNLVLEMRTAMHM